jgi:hypothetical protein
MAENKETIYKISIDANAGMATLRDLKGQIVATQVPVKNLRQEFGNFAKTVNSTSFKKFNNELKSGQQSINGLSKGMSGASAASGSASASVLEVGRAISDSNYGIQGMANNLSQLASNLVYTTKTAGGLTKGLKALGSAFLGPLGLIVIIQSALALWEGYALSQRNATKEIDNLSKATSKGASNLVILKRAIDDGQISQEELARSLKAANKEYEGLNIKVDENGKLTDESVVAIDNKIAAMRRLSKALAVQALVEEQYAKLIPLQAKQDELTEKAIKNENIAIKALTQSYRENGTAVVQASAKRARAAVDANLKAQEEINKEIDRLIKLANKEDLFDEQFKVPEASKNNKRIREYKQQLLDLNKFILSQNKEALLSKERNEFQKLLITQEYAHKDLEATRDSYKAKNKVRFDNFMKEAKDEDAKNRAMAQYREANGLADLEFTEAQDALKAKNKEERDAFIVKLEEKHQSDMIKAKGTSNKATLGRAKGFAKVLGADGAEGLAQAMETAGAVDDELFQKALDIKRQQMEDAHNTKEQIAEKIGEMTYQNDLARAQREIDIEQMKIDAKMKINQEYIGWTQGLTSIFKSIAGENEDLAKAALFLEKGAAIAGIVVNTQASNAKIISASTAEAAGYNSAAAQTAASLGGGIQGAAAALPYITKAKNAVLGGKKRITKNNVGAGISIASILATTLSSKGSTGNSGGGGASGGGGQSRNFDFNLVGNTGQNQLAQGIASQFNQPVQAYVVGSQITSQQQLDATIQSNASIG